MRHKSVYSLKIIQLWAVALLLMTASAASGKDLTLGVLAFRPKPETQAKWQPLADYLTHALRGTKVRLEVLDYPELEKALDSNKLDFVLTNPGHFVHLRHTHNLSGALATLIETEGGVATEFFGGVMIALQDREDIRDLKDLAGKTIAAVSITSLGGYQAQALELQQAGVQLTRDARVITTQMPHDRVVEAVLQGKADAGFVRTGVLEAMIRERKLDMTRLKVLARRDIPNFPYLISTRLYPEWPFIVLPQVDENISRQVAAALLGLEHSGTIARKCGIHGFTIPADYAPVEDLLRTLRFPPFDSSPAFTFKDVWQRYRPALIALIISVVIIGFLTIWLVINNRRLVFARTTASEYAGKYLLLAKNTSDIFWEIDLRTSRYTYLSPSVFRLTGYAPEEIIAQPFETTLTPESYNAVREWLAQDAREFATGRQELQSSVKQLELWCKDRRTIWVEVSATYTLDNDQHPITVNGISRDITERRRTEQVIRENETKFRAVFEKSVDAIGISKAGIHVFVNPAYLSLFGYESNNELFGKSILDLIAPSEHPVIIDRIQRRTRGETVLSSYETRGLRRNGYEFVLDVHASTYDLFDETYTLVILRDITEQKISEKTLHENIQKYRALIETTGTGYVIIDGQGRVVDANSEYIRLSGHSSLEEIQGRNVIEWTAAHDLERNTREVRKCIERGSVRNLEIDYKGRDGGIIPIEINATVIHNQTGTVVLTLCRDIGARKKVENELKRAKDEWERTFDAISDPVMILDTNYRIVKANEAMAHAIGVTPDRAVGMTCYRSVHGTETPPDYCPHSRLLSDGQARSQEVHEPRLGGHYLITVSPLHAPDGALIGSIHTARDITLLKKAEEISREYSQDLEQLITISRGAASTTDRKTLFRSYVTASQQLLKLDFSTLMLLSEDGSSLTIEDCLGFPESMIGSFNLAKGQGLATHVITNKVPGIVTDFMTETRFEVPAVVLKNNILSAIAVPMMIKDDVVGVLIGHTLDHRSFSQKDITIFQHIANEAAVAIKNIMNMDMLRKSEKYVRDITASLNEGVYVLNTVGEITFMNPEAEALLGWSEKELINKNIHNIVHNRKADGSTLLFEDCEMRRVIENRNRFHSTDEVFVRKDGTVFPVSIYSTPLIEHGNVVASITAFRDISDRKHIEQEREKLIIDLQKAIAEIKTLHGILPICSFCKKIRDDKGAWQNLEMYISRHTEADFSHGLCQDCARKHYPDYYKDDK